MGLPLSVEKFADRVPRPGKELFQRKDDSTVDMKNIMRQLMQKIMKIYAVRIGSLPAFVAEFLIQKQVLVAVPASFLRLDHGNSFIKIMNSILILFKFSELFCITVYLMSFKQLILLKLKAYTLFLLNVILYI